MSDKYSYLDDLLDEGLEAGYDQPIDVIISDLTSKYELTVRQAAELKKLASKRPLIKE